MGVVITSLEHGQRGGRQHLGQALEVGHVLLLPGKYVDYLIRTEKTQTISVCVCGGGDGGVYLPGQVKGRGLREAAVDLTEHPAQLGHHGPKVLQEGSDGLIEHCAHRLVGRGGGRGAGG